MTNLIKDLPNKHKASGLEDELIETLYGLGYRFKPMPLKLSENSQVATQSEKGQNPDFSEGLALIHLNPQETPAYSLRSGGRNGGESGVARCHRDEQY